MVDIEKINEEIEKISTNKIKSIELSIIFRYESPRRSRRILITKNPLEIVTMIGGYKLISDSLTSLFGKKIFINLSDIILKKIKNIDKEENKCSEE